MTTTDATRLRGVIFDFDGTLADTVPMCVAAFQAATRHVGVRDYSPDEIVALFGPSEEGILQQVVGDDWEDAFRVFLTTYEREHDACTAPFSGILPVLDLLVERSVQLAIVTGKGRHSAAISVRRIGLERYFTIVECGSPDGPVKPAAIRAVVNGWDIPPEQVAYVGDAPLDMRDAHETGLVALGAAWASSTRLDALRVTQPHALFTTVAAFHDWLQRHV